MESHVTFELSNTYNFPLKLDISIDCVNQQPSGHRMHGTSRNYRTNHRCSINQTFANLVRFRRRSNSALTIGPQMSLQTRQGCTAFAGLHCQIDTIMSISCSEDTHHYNNIIIQTLVLHYLTICPKNFNIFGSFGSLTKIKCKIIMAQGFGGPGKQLIGICPSSRDQAFIPLQIAFEVLMELLIDTHEQYNYIDTW